MPVLTVDLSDLEDVRRSHAVLTQLLVQADDRRRVGLPGAGDGVLRMAGAARESIDTLDLPGRARTALVRSGVHTVGQLTRLSVDELYGLPGVGRATGHAVESALRMTGTELARGHR